MASQFSLDAAYLAMASTWSGLSSAKRKKVGCLIVKNGSIISDGYNGTPMGFSNECEDKIPLNKGSLKMMIDDEGHFVEGTYSLLTKPEVLHAESNAITKLAKSTQSSVASTMYITISPCVDCAKLIIQTEIKRVVYSEQYKGKEGINLLKKAKIQVEKHERIN